MKRPTKPKHPLPNITMTSGSFRSKSNIFHKLTYFRDATDISIEEMLYVLVEHGFTSEQASKVVVSTTGFVVPAKICDEIKSERKNKAKDLLDEYEKQLAQYKKQMAKYREFTKQARAQKEEQEVVDQLKQGIEKLKEKGYNIDKLLQPK